jgi:glycine hydroxymethyltransferase
MLFYKKEFEKEINKTIFPGTSGGPHFNKIAAIGQACLEILGEDQHPDGLSFVDYSKKTLENTKALENSLKESGLEIISPTENHLCLVKLPEDKDSLEIQKKLERIGIICNRNVVPFDTKTAWRPSGLRLGMPALTSRGANLEISKQIGQIIGDCVFDRNSEEELTKKVKDIIQGLNWW